MALATATITYDIADLTGVDFDSRRTRVWVTTNIPDGTIADTVGNQVRLGDGRGSLADDGTGSVTVWVPGTGSNPASWQTTLHVDYQPRGGGGRVVRNFGPFTITANADLADLVAEQVIPAAAVGGDTAVAGFVNSPTSATTAALATAIASKVNPASAKNPVTGAFHVSSFGAIGDGSADDTAAIQAAINAAAADSPNIFGYKGGKVWLDAKNYRIGQLTIPGRITIEGQGRHTWLRLRGLANDHMLVLASATVGEVSLRFLSLDGNKASQSVTGDGIHFVGSTDASALYAANTLNQHDSNHRIHDLYVTNFKGNGVYIEGRGESQYTNIYSWKNDGRGFHVNAPDNRWTGCSAGDNGLEGWYIAAGNNQLVGCKSWYSGRVNNSAGDGFYIGSGRNELSGCEAQDNYGNGFTIASDNNALSGCVADSNNRLAGTSGLLAAGFYFSNSASYNTVTGVSMDRSVVAGTPDQAFGVAFSATGTYENNRVIVTCKGLRTGRLNPQGQSLTGNDIQVNSANGVRVTAFTTPWKPPVYFGGFHQMTLTGDLSITKPTEQHAGQKLHLDLTQDATGGRNVTFDSSFITTRAVNFEPNSRSEWDFIYDGTNWIDQASHVHRDPLRLGFVGTLAGTQTQTVAWAAANQSRFARVLSGGQISKVRISVVVASGNISIAVYRKTGVGLAAVPGTMLASTGAIACPAVGDADIALGSTVTVEPGDFIAMSCDNTTASFVGISGATSNLFAGQSYSGFTQHPLPASPTALVAAQFRLPAFIGL